MYVCMCISHLVGGHFSVSGAERDAKFEALLLDLLHTGQRGASEVGRGHVVVAHLKEKERRGGGGGDLCES